jgi:signal transduction histidine kinase
MATVIKLTPSRQPLLNANGFCRAFPFYVQLDKQLHIVQIGRSMEKIIGPIEHRIHVNNVFQVLYPKNMGTYEDLQRNIGETLTLVSCTGNIITFRGYPEQGEDNTLLLLLTPVLQSQAEQQDAGLSFSDFAKHDISADTLLLTQTTRMSALDAERISMRLRHRSEQLNSILELNIHGVVFFDSEQSILHVNSAFLEILGLKRADALDMCLADLDAWLLALSDKDAGDCPSLTVLRETYESEKLQTTLHLARPRSRIIRLVCAHSSDGGTVYYLRDITHETEVDRMKSEFLAAAAHELRTPMVSIFGFSELLIHRKFKEEQRTDMLQTIHRQSGLLVKMVNELLDLARIESRRGLDLQIQSHSLRELIENCVKGLMRVDTDRQVNVATVPNVSVMIDPEKMQLAINNLLNNAFKYSPQGGSVTLHAYIDNIGTEPLAVIEISDRGIGMSPTQLDKAFERFYRADESGNIPGTGLGLSMVKEIAELHKGSIKLTSEMGVGTVAILGIPLAALPNAADLTELTSHIKKEIQ